MAEPAKASYGRTDEFDADNVRIAYSASTMGGSSGSPVFDKDFRVIALHHFGDPKWVPANARRNRGVPIWKIYPIIAEYLPGPSIGSKPTKPPTDFPTVVWLGQPVDAPAAEPSAIVKKVVTDLTGWADISFSDWPDNWRIDKRLDSSTAAALLAKRPVFIRAIEQPWASAFEMASEIRTKLAAPFGLKPGQESPESAKALLACPAVLWRPNGPDWDEASLQQVNAEARAGSPADFTGWLREFVGLPTDTGAYIHIEHPGFGKHERGSVCTARPERRGGSSTIYQATEHYLLQAFGVDSNTRLLRPNRDDGSVEQAILRLPRGGRQIVALSDYFRVSEPATLEAATAAFSKINQEIEHALSNRPDLEIKKIAVLVRSADEAQYSLSFPRKSGLPDWFLLPITKCDGGNYSVEDDYIEFMKERL